MNKKARILELTTEIATLKVSKETAIDKEYYSNQIALKEREISKLR